MKLPTGFLLTAILAVTVCVQSSQRALGEDETPAPAGPPLPPLAATVNGEPIFVAEVQHLAEALLKNQQSTDKSRTAVQAEVLRQIVNRRLAEGALRRDGYVSQEEIDKIVKKNKETIEARKLTVEQYAVTRGISPATMEHEIVWQLGWKQYLERHLADELESYFKEHHEAFDGTQIRASHVLVRSDHYGDSMPKLLAQAAQIREEIESGSITLEQAAEKYSAGPSAKQGGDLGYFTRYGVMVEPFSKAAFELKKGELSQPVTTAFGVHLIRVTDVKPGTRVWTQATEQIKTPASMHLFEKLVAKELPGAKIEFTGKSPYFKPGTTELVEATAAPK